MNTDYEVVWCVGGVMYIWGFTHKGEDVNPMELPAEVEKVTDFIDRLNRPIPVMVYRLKNDGTMPSYCSHSNADAKPDLFANADDWLKKQGFKCICACQEPGRNGVGTALP